MHMQVVSCMKLWIILVGTYMESDKIILIEVSNLYIKILLIKHIHIWYMYYVKSWKNKKKLFTCRYKKFKLWV